MNLARRLLSYSLPYRNKLLVALGMILFTSISINFLPVIIQRITDQSLMNTEADALTRLDTLVHLSILYISIAIIGHSVRYLQGILTAWIGQKIIYDLRVEVYNKVINMHQGYFDKTATGTLMTRVSTDIERLHHFVTDGVVGTIADLFMLVGIMGYMVYISPILSLSIFITLPFLFAFMLYINKKLRAANRDIRDRQSDLNALIQEDLTGMTTIQLFNREKSTVKDFTKKNSHLRSAYFDEVRWFSLYFPVIEGGQSLAILLILVVGGLLILNGSQVITLGVFIAFLAYVRDFFRPLGSLSDKAGSFQVAMASIERIFNLLDEENEIKNPATPLSAKRLSGVIAFNHVWFAYTPGNWVIKDLSFTMEPGKSLAVVGATGAGKSTIISLIGRFYDIQKGSITIDGEDIKNFNTVELRQHLGYVFQDPFVFSGSVANNISLNSADLSRHDVIHAAKKVDAHPFIEALPQGYDTLLNEEGAGLSLGQKQLLVIARTFAQGSKVLFVLDEATASIDTMTEQLIQHALSQLMLNRTTIIIAHRLSTIRHADKILVMRHGELVAIGSHEELLISSDYYRNLNKLLKHEPKTLPVDLP